MGFTVILDKYLKKEIIEENFDNYYFVNCLTDSIKSCDIEFQTDLIKWQFWTGEYSFGKFFADYYNNERQQNLEKKLKKFLK